MTPPGHRLAAAPSAQTDDSASSSVTASAFFAFAKRFTRFME
jgi:hypothetical protein